MSLFAKFGVVSFMLAATFLVSMGIPTWAVSVADREVRAAQANLMSFVESLHRIKEALDQEAEELMSGSLSRSDRDRLELQSLRVAAALQEIETSSSFRHYAGAGIAPAFAQRVRLTRNHLDRAIQVSSTDPAFAPGMAEATSQLAQLQVVFDLVEERLFGELQLTIAHSNESRSLVQRIFSLSLGLSLLVGALALLLLRRWVILPVLDLRIAAEQISAGNLDYRVAARSQDELGVLAAEINRMAATVQDRQARAVARERFATVEELTRRLAHNLRNPLAGIRSLAESARIRSSIRDPVSEDLDMIVSTVDRFESWLSKLLHSASTLEIHPREDSPREMVAAVADVHQLMARARNVCLTLDLDGLPERAVFDRMHLEQAVVALVTNALEATADGGSVHLSGQGPSQSGEWAISVEDTGPGVHGADRDEVFRPYFTTKQGGTGLGLALVGNVARAHEGRVEIRDSALGGATFTIYLPGPVVPDHGGDSDGQHRSC